MSNEVAVINVPTYIDEKGHTEPHVPVSVISEQGVRLVLGGREDSPDILVERRQNGWMIAISPQGVDSTGLVYIIDDGRSFVVPDGLPSEAIQWSEEVPKEVDAHRGAQP